MLLGAGDSGYFVRGDRYSTVLTGGGSVRYRIGKHLELGGGGQVNHEPKVVGNANAPHRTPGVDYEDFVRGEVAEQYVLANPGQEDDFPDPVPTAATSWKAIGYLGFGRMGPIRWNNLFARYERRHPGNVTVETYEDRDYSIYLRALTDERFALTVGNEMHLVLVPGRLDAAWGLLYGDFADGDNAIAPSDDDQTIASTVVRFQLYLTDVVHLLLENAVAQERSKNGNRYREHVNSVFANDGGVADTRGLEFGDSDSRNTWQGKVGVVLNPLGTGLYTRPSLRILYGAQYSNQNNAFGNSFVDSLDEYNSFGAKERHWHHVAGVEVEAWF